tara:strand:- start:510 stop:839 length:330 start_codon:yes stop_codon:yes gene_type:complete
MNDSMLYIETTSDTALNITEDIVHLQIAKNAINKLSHVASKDYDGTFISKDERYQIVKLINDAERRLRSELRKEHIQPTEKKVYESLRKKVKEELKKEGYKFDENFREC